MIRKEFMVIFCNLSQTNTEIFTGKIIPGVGLKKKKIR